MLISVVVSFIFTFSKFETVKWTKVELETLIKSYSPLKVTLSMDWLIWTKFTELIRIRE